MYYFAKMDQVFSLKKKIEKALEKSRNFVSPEMWGLSLCMVILLKLSHIVSNDRPPRNYL